MNLKETLLITKEIKELLQFIRPEDESLNRVAVAGVLNYLLYNHDEDTELEVSTSLIDITSTVYKSSGGLNADGVMNAEQFKDKINQKQAEQDAHTERVRAKNQF